MDGIVLSVVIVDALVIFVAAGGAAFGGPADVSVCLAARDFRRGGRIFCFRGGNHDTNRILVVDVVGINVLGSIVWWLVQNILKGSHGVRRSGRRRHFGARPRRSHNIPVKQQ